MLLITDVSLQYYSCTLSVSQCVFDQMSFGKRDSNLTGSEWFNKTKKKVLV